MKTQPKTAAEWNRLGCENFDQGDLSQAEKAFRRAIELGALWAGLNLGNTLTDLDRPLEAVTAYETAIAAGETAAYLNLGRVLMGLGDLDAAQQQLLRAVGSGDAGGWLALADLAEMQADKQRQESCLRSALEAGHPVAPVLLARFLILDDREAEAEAVIGQADPDDDDEARLEVGCMLIDEGHYQEAKGLYRRAAEQGLREYLIPLGNVLADHMDQDSEAEEVYRTAISLGDDFAHHNLAVLLDRKGRSSEAIAEYKAGAEAGDEMAEEVLREYGVQQDPPRLD